MSNVLNKLLVGLFVCVVLVGIQGCENPDDEMMYDKKDTKIVNPEVRHG